MGVQIILGGGSVWFGGQLFGTDPKRMYKYHRSEPFSQKGKRRVAHAHVRASGYFLMILFLLVVHLGGAWSNFSLRNGSTLLRYIAYLLSPLVIVAGVGSRIR